MVEVKVCAKCGGSISNQSIIEGKAKFHEGKLICSNCIASAAAPAPGGGGGHDDQPIAFDAGDEPISFDNSPSEASSSAAESESADHIQVFAGEKATQRESKQYKRQPTVTGKGATRVRTFDTKLSRGAMEMLDEQINQWLDETGYEVKFVSTTVGDVQGKKIEPHLIINIWY